LLACIAFDAHLRNDGSPGCSNDLEFFSIGDAQQMVAAHYDTIKLVGLIDRGNTDP
jgi:hypothetical protein